jgi:hypothetical protein
MSVYERLWSACGAAPGAGGSLPFLATAVDDIHNFHNNNECVDRPLWQTLGPHVH